MSRMLSGLRWAAARAVSMARTLRTTRVAFSRSSTPSSASPRPRALAVRFSIWEDAVDSLRE